MKNLALVGQRLNNGATVLACQGDIVLCLNGSQFVTWEIDTKLNAFYGDYFECNLSAALEGYQLRVTDSIV